MDYMIYYIIGAGVIYLIWKGLPFFRKLKGLFVKIPLNKKSTLTEEQYKKVAVSALYSVQQTAYVNSLSTGLGKMNLRGLLAKWWGINTPQEAEETLEYLKDKGYRFYFDTIFEAYSEKSPQAQERLIVERFQSFGEEDMQKAYHQLQNLKETWRELTENKIIRTAEDLKRYTNKGWDFGRLSFLSRVCFDAGYISEEKAWYYIDAAYQMAAESFQTWEDFSKSYIIGRGMWGGKSCHNVGIMSIAEDLLKEENSPWVQIPLK